MNPLRVLIIEDSEADAILLLRELKKAGLSPEHRRVGTAEEMERALAEQSWDVVLCDYVMPDFSCPAALEILNRRGLDIPPHCRLGSNRRMHSRGGNESRRSGLSAQGQPETPGASGQEGGQ